jgi:hypothetical protein
MIRIPRVRSNECEWLPVSDRSPCTLCAGVDRCYRALDGGFARCSRLPSEWPLLSGGWLHRTELDIQAQPLVHSPPALGADRP